MQNGIIKMSAKQDEANYLGFEPGYLIGKRFK
jgi:hypothetical protein